MDNMIDNTNKIKVVIVDDEPQSILRLQTDLMELGDFDVIATSSSSMSAKTLVMGMLPDVLFLDVEMPGQTGFEVLQSIREEMPTGMITVFYSAFDKYTIDALRASAFDFLLKPYQREEFELVVDRIRKKMSDIGDDDTADDSDDSQASSLDDMLGLEGLTGLASKRAAIQTVSGLLMVKPDEVFSCIYDEDTRIWNLKMTNGTVHKLKKQTTSKTLLSISPSMAQVRQDCIINLDYLISIENTSLRCVFVPPFDKEDIVVSRRCYKAVKEQLEIL